MIPHQQDRWNDTYSEAYIAFWLLQESVNPEDDSSRTIEQHRRHSDITFVKSGHRGADTE